MYALAMWTVGISLLALLAGINFSEIVKKYQWKKKSMSNLSSEDKHRSLAATRRPR